MSKARTGMRPWHHFFLEYGQFLAAWNSFDILIEVALMRQLRLTVREACVVFASVGFGAKHNILGALMTPTEEGQRKYKIVQEAIQLAERNSFAHGFISVDEARERFVLVRREVKGSLEVRPKDFSPLLMQKHAHLFFGKFEEAMQAFGITDHDLIKYQREVESFAKPPQAPNSSRLQSATSFAEAKKLSRRERRAQKKAKLVKFRTERG
jgi:hypothetical protein